MVPQEYFALYVGANAIAFGILALAFFRPPAQGRDGEEEQNRSELRRAA